MSYKPSLAKSPTKSVASVESDTIPQPRAEIDHRKMQRNLDLEREPVRQALFQRKANQALKLPNGYLKVAVLIIRWDRDLDDFQGHTAEIDRLQGIFEDDFGYTCEVYPIKNLKKPQVDLNWAILNHIKQHDDPNSLLIFYYTGHGYQSERFGLELAATDNIENAGGAHAPTALWRSAEEPIREIMDGDALSILDCCMASTAGIKCKNGLPRTYQLLAASAADAVTYGPGQNSFTTALCESLRELLKEADGSSFLLTQLCERINTKRKSQACLSWDRLRTFKRTVQLGRLEQSANLEDSFININKVREESSLLLRLSFRTSDLNNKEIERLAEQLPHACHLAEVPLRRIDWVKMEQESGTVPMHHNGDVEIDDATIQVGQETGYFGADENGVFEPGPIDFYTVSRTINAVQRFRNAVGRRRASKHHPQLCRDGEGIVLPCGSARARALKISTLLFTFSLLYFRRDTTGLVLWVAFLALMGHYLGILQNRAGEGHEG